MADRSILIVDDNEINRGILGEIFKDKYNIIEADNGIQAMKEMEAHESELAAILLDIIMPEMDGYAVLEAMQQKDNLNDTIPVLMICIIVAARRRIESTRGTIFTFKQNVSTFS